MKPIIYQHIGHKKILCDRCLKNMSTWSAIKDGEDEETRQYYCSNCLDYIQAEELAVRKLK